METPGKDDPRRATARDILAPNGTAADSIDPRFQKHFERLTQMRDELARRRSAQVEAAGSFSEAPNFANNLADRGSDEYDMEAALSLISTDQNALYEIDQAIQRIRDGSYGICEATGKPIPEERLEAIPWARFARDVEESLERGQQARKPRHAF